MAGILLYNLFLVLGFLCACLVFKKHDIWYKVLAGGIIGNIALMFGIVPIACFMDFTITAHIVLLVLAVGALAAYVFVKKPALQFVGTENKFVDRVALLGGILPVSIVICLLLTNHVMTPVTGGIGSGQSTYGDLAMHMGFVTSIAEQKIFPPDYSLMTGERLSYPFLINSLSGSLVLFGTDLRAAILIPSYVMCFLLVLGFYNLAFSLTKRRSASLLALWFFFLNGAFGFAYFFEGAKADKSAFTRIFTEWYKTPTNLNEMNIRWSNTICDMIVPQRTTMAGWTVLVYLLSLLKDALDKKEIKLFVLLGLLAGAMPMIHTHSFLALGIISAAAFFAFIFEAEDKKEYLYNWVVYGVLAISIAMPQLVYWTFAQTTGNESFLKAQFNWVNHNDPYFWFWIKNWGIVFLLMIPAYLGTSLKNKKLAAGAILIFIIAELIVFQQNEYDNNKLFYVVYMFAVIFVAEWLINVYDKLRDVKGIGLVAAIVILCQTLSGGLTVAREYISGGQYRTFSDDSIALAEWIKENTETDDIFITGSQHLNPVNALAGRRLYVGTGTFIYFHGYKDEYNRKRREVEKVYKAESAAEAVAAMDKIGGDYLLVTSYERNDFEPDEKIFSGMKKVFRQGEITLYKR